MITLSNGWKWDTDHNTLLSPPSRDGKVPPMQIATVTSIVGEKIEGTLPDGRPFSKYLICEHGQLTNVRESARCDHCGERLGWWCPNSPDHLCHYTENYDSCDYCGQPEERK